MVEEPQHLFVTPTVLGAIDGPAYDVDADALSNPWELSDGELSLQVAGLEKVLRALLLAGYRPQRIELGVRPEAPATIVVADLLSRVIHTSTGAPDDILWISGPEDAVVIVEFVPWAYGDALPALALPPTGSGWVLESPTESAVDSTDIDEIELHRLQLNAQLQTGDPAQLAADICAGAADDFVAQVVAMLAARWGEGLASSDCGLLWLFDPSYWWSEDVQLELPGPARAAQRLAEKALWPADAAAGEVEAFLLGQIEGRDDLEAVLLAVTGKRVKSRSRARRSGRAFERWADRDDSPVQPLPQALETGFETLSWLDLLFVLTETGMLDPPSLPSSGEGELELEPLVALQIDDDTIELELYRHPVMRLTRANPTNGPRPALQRSFAWEYVPEDDENLERRLIIVAGPGVLVEETDEQGLLEFVEVTVVRVWSEKLIPPWGFPIDVSVLLQPYLLPYESDEAPIAEPSALLVEPRERGVTLSYFTAYSGSAEPVTRVDVELAEHADAVGGFRFEFDFVLITRAEEALTWSVEAVLRVWATSSGVTIQQKSPGNPIVWLDFRRADDLWDIFTEEFETLPITSPIGEPPTESQQIKPVFGVPDDEAPRLESNDFLIAKGLQPVAADEWDRSWPGIDWVLMVVDIGFGMIPVAGDVADIAEFVHAFSTGRDRWGRPVSELDLWLMGIGAAIPIASSGLFRGAADNITTLAKSWLPDVTEETADSARKLLADAEEGLDVGADVLEAVGKTAGDPLPGRTPLEVADLLNGEGDGFLYPSLQAAYEKWRARKLLADPSLADEVP